MASPGTAAYDEQQARRARRRGRSRMEIASALQGLGGLLGTLGQIKRYGQQQEEMNQAGRYLAGQTGLEMPDEMSGRAFLSVAPALLQQRRSQAEAEAGFQNDRLMRRAFTAYTNNPDMNPGMLAAALPGDAGKDFVGLLSSLQQLGDRQYTSRRAQRGDEQEAAVSRMLSEIGQSPNPQAYMESFDMTSVAPQHIPTLTKGAQDRLATIQSADEKLMAATQSLSGQKRALEAATGRISPDSYQYLNEATREKIRKEADSSKQKYMADAALNAQFEANIKENLKVRNPKLSGNRTFSDLYVRSFALENGFSGAPWGDTEKIRGDIQNLVDRLPDDLQQQIGQMMLEIQQESPGLPQADQMARAVGILSGR